MKSLVKVGQNVFTACSLKGPDACNTVDLSIWIISFFGPLESTMKTAPVSHHSGCCQRPAHTLGTHLENLLPRIAVTLPDGFYLAMGACCPHTSKTQVLESKCSLRRHHSGDDQESLPSTGIALTCVSSTVPRAPQWDCTGVAHGGPVLGETPCTGCFPSPVSLPYSPPGVSWYHPPNRSVACASLSQSLLQRDEK